MFMAEEYLALVVEDDPTSREATVAALNDEGIACEAVVDGQHALTALDQRHFDIVIADLKLPRRNGHALAIDLMGRGPKRPLVVVLTGVLEPRLVRDLIARGVDDIAFKPAD